MQVPKHLQLVYYFLIIMLLTSFSGAVWVRGDESLTRPTLALVKVLTAYPPQPHPCKVKCSLLVVFIFLAIYNTNFPTSHCLTRLRARCQPGLGFPLRLGMFLEVLSSCR